MYSLTHFNFEGAKSLNVYFQSVVCGVVSKEEIPTVSSRGRGRRRKAGGRVGGVVTRRARLNNSTTLANDMASADVYEFRDDSEEEANRPRLILTIKSPPDPSPSPSNNNSASTRKSRRLQVNFIFLFLLKRR